MFYSIFFVIFRFTLYNDEKDGHVASSNFVYLIQGGNTHEEADCSGARRMLSMAACAALAADLKIGAVMLGDETEGYTLAHMEGIKQAAAELGLSDSIVWKYKVPEDQTCYDSALDLVGQGCNLIISNSYGHQTYMALAAKNIRCDLRRHDGDFAALPALTISRTHSPRCISPAMCPASWQA
ncbi:MAG: hypothetical protein ACLUI3_03630 [Christensenellales bacterium]